MANEVFHVGDHVRWVRAVASPECRNAIGVILAIVPDDRNSREFSIYEVRFTFGTRTLYGTQIECVSISHTA